MIDSNFVFCGKAFVFPDNFDTDTILPAIYLNLADENELASHCMENSYPDFRALVKHGDIIIAGDNFGCGSSREHAPVAIKGCGISCVVAKSFSRLFYRNAINIGLPAITADLDSFISEGDEIAVDCITGTITLVREKREFPGEKLPPFMLEILGCGGLVGYLMKRTGEPTLSG